MHREMRYCEMRYYGAPALDMSMVPSGRTGVEPPPNTVNLGVMPTWSQADSDARDAALELEAARGAADWEQVDWVAAPASWRLQGLYGLVPVSLLTAVFRVRGHACGRDIRVRIRTSGSLAAQNTFLPERGGKGQIWRENPPTAATAAETTNAGRAATAAARQRWQSRHAGDAMLHWLQNDRLALSLRWRAELQASPGITSAGRPRPTSTPRVCAAATSQSLRHTCEQHRYMKDLSRCHREQRCKLALSPPAQAES
ncbi:hypothetical protein ACLKA6_017626 [Drosophila palustris]